jgi:hypothetical protein
MELNGIHGTCYHEGYIYGSCRHSSCIGKIPVDDYSGYTILYSGLFFGGNQESIIFAKNKFWVSGATSIWITLWFTPDLLNSGIIAGNTFGPSVADADYLYTGTTYLNKISLDTGELILTRAITDDHPEPSVGLHSMVVDGDYIYGSCPSTDPDGGWFVKIRKLDLITESYVRIPMCTDDMCQDSEYCYLGVEVSPYVSGTIGCDMGAYRVKKSDLSTYSVPTFESQAYSLSYASQIFGEYLIDIKTNNHIYVMSLPNMELLKDFRLVNLDYSSDDINEIIRDEEGYFHFTQWQGNGTAPSRIIKVDLDLTYDSGKCLIISE